MSRLHPSPLASLFLTVLETVSYETQADFRFTLWLRMTMDFWSSKCWLTLRHVPSHLAMVLGIEPRAFLHTLNRAI